MAAQQFEEAEEKRRLVESEMRMIKEQQATLAVHRHVSDMFVKIFLYLCLILFLVSATA